MRSVYHLFSVEQFLYYTREVEYFFLRFFILMLLLFLFIKKEFSQRKERGLQPSSLSELFSAGSKWKKGSDPNISALLFSSSAFVGFALWESLLIMIFNLVPYLLITLPLGIIAAVLLLKKREDFHLWTFKESQLALLALGLVSGALFCWVLFPWVYFRALFLKKS